VNQKSVALAYGLSDNERVKEVQMKTAIYHGTEHPYLLGRRVAIGKVIQLDDVGPHTRMEVYPILPNGKISFVSSDALLFDLTNDGKSI
jgi:hypothetical protein